MRHLATLGTGLVLAAAFLAGAAKDEVIYIDSQKVAANFAKGGTLLNKDTYQILTSRRVETGTVEVHAHYMDIMYVTEGSATIVTGGTVVDGKATAPDEIRGASIKGGESHMLKKGDVFVVPVAVPHWFQKVDKLVTYYVVKIKV
jgi:mannose-6-phosphate isomerase-like protein (cupin superfamily)